ncbi:hypothetical protein NM688_g4961 [Phlebia brevispora]|uniref:Uncharacterized protein n=1 Tax=Phlebia brevispora TaxID=194682 RepID=A0ACC1T1P9_9APHY|nr:hypothetical protein NM688_g4961 [Phlebia brevispora]
MNIDRTSSATSSRQVFNRRPSTVLYHGLESIRKAFANQDEQRVEDPKSTGSVGDSRHAAVNNASPDGPYTNPTGLSGWAAVEDHMYKRDQGSMRNYSEEIDTLLVFAGLFSAVLTAFIVPSYQMLQSDNTALSVQFLQRISAQLSSITINGPFVNSTAPPTTTISSPPTTSVVRCINALWFLSLVFSLAAAFFGILAKQWVREFLQWNSVLALPEENVMIRQMRFDAWNKSNITTIISTTSALLETAVVLFLIGVVVLLWTLDLITAIIIAVAVTVFFIVISTLTVLPAFMRHCPYKSPTMEGVRFIQLSLPSLL